jgi:phage-related minor tail protein
VDVRELKDEMDGQFEHVQRQFEQVDRRFAELKAELREHIAAEGEKTRRHFDIVAEQMKAEQHLLIDRVMGTDQKLLGLAASNAGDHVGFVNRLDDHEQRLKRIEKK